VTIFILSIMEFILIMVGMWIINYSDCIVVLQDDSNFANVDPDADSEKCEVSSHPENENLDMKDDRPCGLVVRVLDYRSRGPRFDSQALQKKSSGSGTGSTQPREYN
jgi:hypothetical protein